jgi:hypothetical protein
MTSSWLTDEVRARLIKLAEAAEAMAPEIEIGKLVPGYDKAFLSGAPVCAVGHALSRAGFTTTHTLGENWVALDYYMGTFKPGHQCDWEIDPSFKDVREALDGLTGTNDRGYSGLLSSDKLPPRSAERMKNIAEALQKLAQEIRKVAEPPPPTTP